MAGTVQTIQCKRDGRVCWEKPVYVPDAEREAFFARYLGKSAGVFFYDVVGEVKAVQRKPIKTPAWTE